MNYTENYQPNQWEPADRVLRTDFNEDNRKIDAALETIASAAAQANCQIIMGHYTGSGTYGSENKNTLSFQKTPVFLLVVGDYMMFALNPQNRTASLCAQGGNNYYGNILTWDNNSISWYNQSLAALQCNSNGTTYYYIVYDNNSDYLQKARKYGHFTGYKN